MKGTELLNEAQSRAEWEETLGDEYTIRREETDGVTVLVAYDATGAVISSYIITDDGAEGAVDLESVLEHYTPADSSLFQAAVKKVAEKLERPWEHVYYRFTLDPAYYDRSYDEESMLDDQYAFGIRDDRTVAQQSAQYRKAFGLTDDEVEALIAAETFWQDQFNTNN